MDIPQKGYEKGKKRIVLFTGMEDECLCFDSVGAKSFDSASDSLLLSIVDDKLPSGAAGWLEVAVAFNACRSSLMV